MDNLHCNLRVQIRQIIKYNEFNNVKWVQNAPKMNDFALLSEIILSSYDAEPEQILRHNVH